MKWVHWVQLALGAVVVSAQFVQSNEPSLAPVAQVVAGLAATLVTALGVLSPSALPASKGV